MHFNASTIYESKGLEFNDVRYDNPQVDPSLSDFISRFYCTTSSRIQPLELPNGDISRNKIQTIRMQQGLILQNM